MEVDRVAWQLQMAESGRTVDLYPHQKAAVDKLRNGSILCGGVGTGKSRTAMEYYFTREAPSAVYVITTAKKRDSLDWEKEAAAYGIGKSADATVAGILTVDSWNSIGKYVDVKNAFFIFDEQRVVGTGAWVKSFLKITKYNRWILLSATPGDTWLDYAPVFIANGYYKNITEFRREHCVYSHYGSFPKLERYLAEGKLLKLKAALLVDMPYERHTVRHIHSVFVDHDKTLMEVSIKRRWNPFKNKPMKDAAELYGVMRKIANSSLSRLDAVYTLLNAHSKLIVFYNFDYELELLRNLKSATTVSEWNGHKHEPIPDTERWVYLVQYQSGSEGWNCTSTDAMCFYSLTYSYRQWKQSFGRIDRLNTPFTDLHYYVLRSKSFIDMAIWRALKEKRNFNEKTILMKEVVGG
jgi:hypothetical protein